MTFSKGLSQQRVSYGRFELHPATLKQAPGITIKFPDTGVESKYPKLESFTYVLNGLAHCLPDQVLPVVTT